MSSAEESDDDQSVDFQLKRPESGKEGIVFVVDATAKMFDLDQFSLAIQCAINLMKNKAIDRPNDELALILFGTEKTSNEDSSDHIFVVQKLEKISVDSIRAVKRLTDCHFETEFGHNSDYSLADVFSLVISQFKQKKTRFPTKRMILFTSTSNPYSGDTDAAKQMRNLAIMRAQNLKIYDIEVQLIPLSSKDNYVFDYRPFYLHVFPELKDDKCSTLSKLEPLMRRIHAKRHKQRSVLSIPFHLSPNKDIPEAVISVNLYKLYMETKKPNLVRVNKPDDNITDHKTSVESHDSSNNQLLDDKTDAPNEPTLGPSKAQSEESIASSEEAIAPKQSSELRKVWNFGTENFYLKPSDETAIKASIEEPALTLLGFKPRSDLKSHFHKKPGFFIFPNESRGKNAIILFNGLLQRCAHREKVGICRLTLKKSSPPQLVALYPQLENRDEDKAGGFHLVYLPFKEDIRAPPIEGTSVTVRPEARELALKIVNELTVRYDPKDYPNPVIRTHFKALEQLAFDEPCEPFDDYQTQPDYENIGYKVGDSCKELNRLLGAYNVPTATKPVKTYDEMRSLANSRKLGTLTVAQLKDFCQKNKIVLAVGQTRKENYIQAIDKYYNTV